MLLVLAVVTLAAAPPPLGGALERAAESVVARALEGTAGERVALSVQAPAHDGLRQPLLAALAAAVSRRGHAALPLEGPLPQAQDLDAAARAAGASLLLAVRAALSGADLALAAEVRPERPSFFLQRARGVRPGARLVTVAVAADAAARALAGGRRTGPPVLVPLAELPGRVLALAAGPVGADGAVRIAAVTEAALLLLDAKGAVLASRPVPAAPPGPAVRDTAAAVAIGAFPGGRVAWAVAGRSAGEVVSAEGDRLERVADLAAVPLACGGAGPLHGWFAPGRGVFLDALSREPGAAPAAASPRALLSATAAPRPGRVAYAVLQDDFRLRLLGPNLEPAGALHGVGAGFALGDLDGDGEPEVVASSAQPGPDDAVRVLRSDGQVLAPPARVPGAVVAGASADLTGDGLDDAILAAAMPGGGTRLWLVTADPRSEPR